MRLHRCRPRRRYDHRARNDDWPGYSTLLPGRVQDGTIGLNQCAQEAGTASSIAVRAPVRSPTSTPSPDQREGELRSERWVGLASERYRVTASSTDPPMRRLGSPTLDSSLASLMSACARSRKGGCVVPSQSAVTSDGFGHSVQGRCSLADLEAEIGKAHQHCCEVGGEGGWVGRQRDKAERLHWPRKLPLARSPTAERRPV